MSFGWSPSDILTLAKLAYEVYSFCRNAPAELQSLFNRLDKIGRKLERLSTILEKSGLGTWKGAPALEQHLLEAKTYLEPMQSVTNRGTSVPLKATGLARLALRQDKLRRIEKNLDENEREIDELKIDLILVCSLRNLQYANDLELGPFDPWSSPRPTNETLHLLDERLPAPAITSTIPLGLEFDRSSITSMTVLNASKALAMAMGFTSQPSGKTKAVAVGISTPESSLRNVQMTNDFISDVVSLAEETELYSKDADPMKTLEQLNEITERATHFQLALRPSSIDSTSATAQYQLPAVSELNPGSFERGVLGQLSSTSGNPSLRMWAFDLSQRQAGSSYTSATDHPTPPIRYSDRTPPNSLPLQNHSGLENEIFQMDIAPTIGAFRQSDNEPSNKDYISLPGRSEVSLTMNPEDFMSCSFIFEVSEGSVLLRVTSSSRSHSTSAIVASGALPPTQTSSSSRSQSVSYDIHPRLPQTFQHCFQSRARPIPHLLHPDVEGPTEEPSAPYTITFTEPQYIYEEGASEGPRWTSSLRYIFQEKQDRITLCEKIFGKKILLPAGSNKVTYDGREISHMSAITMWFDSASKAKSITFSPNFTRQNADIELRVHGLWDAKKALRNSNAVAVVAESMSRVDEDEGLDTIIGLDRQSSVKSGGTLFSKASSTASQKWKRSGKQKCTIEFTHLSDTELFLSHLN